MEKLKHMKGPWKYTGSEIWAAHERIVMGRGTYDVKDRELRDGVRQLICLAPTAPHSCADPQCPGDINRRKLQAAEEMVALIQKVKQELSQMNTPWTKRIVKLIASRQYAWEKIGNGE